MDKNKNKQKGLYLQKFFTWIGAVLAIGCIGGFVWLVIKMFNWFSEAKADVKLSIASAVLTAFVTIVAVLIAKKKEKEADFWRAQYSTKLEIYQNFVNNLIVKLFLPERHNFKNDVEKKKYEEQKNKDQIAAIQDFIAKVILWGNGSVIHETSIWLKILRNQDNPNVIAAMQQIEPVLRTIREDLGHSNKKIEEGDILRLFIVDYDETLAKGRLTKEDNGSNVAKSGENL